MPVVANAPRLKLTGICAPAVPAIVAQLMRETKASAWLVVTENLRAAEALAEDLDFFRGTVSPKIPTEPALVFPEAQTEAKDMRDAFAASHDRFAVLSRLRAIRGLSSTPDTLVVVTTPAALLQPVPAFEEFSAKELELRPGSSPKYSELLLQLQQLDYDSEAICESPGHYAVRGGIIDLYPVAANAPVRLDFFGDELEEIHVFDPVTQRSGEKLDKVMVSATPRMQLGRSSTGLADYISSAARMVFVEPAILEKEFSALGAVNENQVGALFQRAAGSYGLSDLDESSAWFDGPDSEHTWNTDSLRFHRRFPEDSLVAQDRLLAEEESRHDFLKLLARWGKEGFDIAVVTTKTGEEQRCRELLENDAATAELHPKFFLGPLNEGFRITYRDGDSLVAPSKGKKGLVLVTETEIFGRIRVRRGSNSRRSSPTPRAQVDQLLDFAELVEGDFVVHLQHGIALYRGVTRLDTAQGWREVISLEFDDNVTLHVPLAESHLLSRYVGLGKSKPQLGKIGSGRWEKARQSAERATLDLAAELLRIQASREAQEGFAFPPDNEWQREFEGSFPFTETRDQLKAIVESKADMEKMRPMDRLICGDVGFGKTEVAIRAAFKAVQGGRQVALLVPTTVLAQQHLNTFRERMAGYPVAVEMISRFRSRAEQKKILEAAHAGQVDILIGTHRLLQSDVTFKELGLVVIDEEQRFGVKHKEVFKRMREMVDVLSMSATPIPRTLYLALTGARDLSVIETPPTNRHPIQTIVKTYDEKSVIDAINYEVRRGGQVFYLHNRVQTIEDVAEQLRKMIPGLTVSVGHGQMEPAELERVMTEFVAGRYQVLVCTTIIESGLDIPNCNTIIIEGADHFGLSQLYQLRGRVGRFKHQAYAYLFLHRHARLLDIARQRLTAMRTHNQLGAGFRIAMRDLELRGAGNLLGAEQSGHIVGVGFELYCQLLRQSVSRLRGEKTASYVRANVKIDFVSIGDSDTGANAARGRGARHSDNYTVLRDAEETAAGANVEVKSIRARIPTRYISETRLRIDFYRQLALAQEPKRIEEISQELRDRFGPYTDEVKALLAVTEIRIRAEQKAILSVETDGNRLKCLRNSGKHDDWVQVGNRFPRLTATTPLLRLKEILIFLNNLSAA